VVKGECALEDAIVTGPHGLQIVPAASGIKRMANLSEAEHAGIIRAFSDLYHRVEVLVVDTAAGLHDSVLTFSQAAHHVVVVVCDEPASITDAYALIKVLSREHGVQRFQILANQTRRSGKDRICSKRFRGSVTDFSMSPRSLPARYRSTTTCAAPCSGRRRSSMRTLRLFHRWPSRIWPTRPISGLCHKVHEVTWSSSLNEWWGPGSVLRRYCNESKHTVFKHAEARARSRSRTMTFRSARCRSKNWSSSMPIWSNALPITWSAACRRMSRSTT
jgi:hypothetical protein